MDSVQAKPLNLLHGQRQYQHLLKVNIYGQRQFGRIQILPTKQVILRLIFLKTEIMVQMVLLVKMESELLQLPLLMLQVRQVRLPLVRDGLPLFQMYLKVNIYGLKQFGLIPTIPLKLDIL